MDMVLPSCWNDCDFCDKVMREQPHKKPEYRTYRLCNFDKTPKKCFQDSLLCDRPTYTASFYKPTIKKPTGTGWDDF